MMVGPIKRRTFIAMLSSAVAWPVVARAQQSAMPVVGFINSASAQNYTRQLEAFLKGLGESGYVDGRNVAVEYRWAEGQNDRLPAMAADLVHRQVAVIAATSTYPVEFFDLVDWSMTNAAKSLIFESSHQEIPQSSADG